MTSKCKEEHSDLAGKKKKEEKKKEKSKRKVRTTRR